MCGAVLALDAGVLFSATAAEARTASETANVSVYSVTLKVFVPPVDLFNGPNALTVCRGVLEPNRVSGCMNCFLSAFIKENGKPVGHARVNISYRRLSPKAGPWRELPVCMWIGPEGQTLAETSQTTRFGNDVELLPGRYEARVSVNGRGPATFRFSLHRRSFRKKRSA
jgi:hypothetical protein